MGVKGLWQLLEPVGRPTTLESLEGKVLSVDASILLNQAVKGMRDRSGNPVPNAHLVGIFHRLCKLLFYRIKPVFVFDGGVPVLKKKTLQARRLRKLKARHSSNKAAEKIVKNYLKGKAIETITGRKSDATLRSTSPREPDLFELPPLPATETAEQSSTDDEEEEDSSVLQQLYSQHELEFEFQDPMAIDVESKDFQSLPEEIQHELIMDMKEERKWTIKHNMPEEAHSFSAFQLQSVLQRGKLNQRLDKLRRDMNSRSSGEVAGVADQSSLGPESSVQSRRIVSEDTGHYVLIKGHNVMAGEENDETIVVDNSKEGGFFRDEEESHGEISTSLARSPLKRPPPPIPIFEIPEIDSSESEVATPLLDVPEIVLPPEMRSTAGEVEVTNESRRASKSALRLFEGQELSDMSFTSGRGGENDDIVIKDDHISVISKQTGGRENESGDIVTVREGDMTRSGSTPIDLTSKDSSSFDSEIEKRRKMIESLLKSREHTQESHVTKESSTCGSKFSVDPHSTRPNEVLSSLLPLDGERVCAGTGPELENTRDNRKESLQAEGDVAEFSLKLDSSEESSSPSKNSEDGAMGFSLELESSQDELMTVEHSVCQSDDSKPQVSHTLGVEPIDHKEDDVEYLRDHEPSSDEDSQGKDTETIQDKGSLLDTTAEKSDMAATVIDDRVTVEQQTAGHDVIRDSVRQIVSEPAAPVISEFAGTSKEDLEVMQCSLEAEQQSLEAERARQARAATTVSNEMFTESQELLRLFGVPYLVCPMEAEAQCAFLDLTDQTDGTITDDSDVFLFGGRRVYKNIFNQNKHAELYASDSIEKNLALDRYKMIKLAYITGSDYTEGIQGLGGVGAMEVLYEFNHDGFHALEKLKNWHDEAQERGRTKYETKIKTKLRTLTLPTGFPSREVYSAYASPVVDESRETFEWAKPDLHALRLFALDKLGWPKSKTDEMLLPVMKQLNRQDAQMTMDKFFQVKFQETRKVRSKRVRRVVNRFFHPSSSSSNSEEEGNTETRDDRRKTGGHDSPSGTKKVKRATNMQSNNRKAVGKMPGSRGLNSGRSRGRGRASTRGIRGAGSARSQTSNSETRAGQSSRSRGTRTSRRRGETLNKTNVDNSKQNITGKDSEGEVNDIGTFSSEYPGQGRSLVGIKASTGVGNLRETVLERKDETDNSDNRDYEKVSQQESISESPKTSIRKRRGRQNDELDNKLKVSRTSRDTNTRGTVKDITEESKLLECSAPQSEADDDSTSSDSQSEDERRPQVISRGGHVTLRGRKSGRGRSRGRRGSKIDRK